MTETEHIDKERGTDHPDGKGRAQIRLALWETDYRNTHLNQTFRTRTNSENTSTPTTEEEHRKI